MTAMPEMATEDVIVQSKVLGALQVPVSQIYVFPDEIYGFPGARSFALLSAERPGFFWLQSADFEALTFLLIDPFAFVEGYSVDVGPDELGGLQSDDPSHLLVASILTLPREPGGDATTNLQGPIVFNMAKQLGKQVVTESPFGIRHPITVSGE